MLRRLLIFASIVVLVDTSFYAAITPLLPHLTDEFGLSKTGAGKEDTAKPKGNADLSKAGAGKENTATTKPKQDTAKWDTPNLKGGTPSKTAPYQPSLLQSQTQHQNLQVMQQPGMLNTLRSH